MVLRFQPMLAPILHEINAYVHYFFVPYRLLWDSWEDFITGGPEGNLTPSLPTWVGDDQTATVGTLWDYFGFQTIPASSGMTTTPTAAPSKEKSSSPTPARINPVISSLKPDLYSQLS